MAQDKKVTFTVIGEEDLGQTDITDIADRLAQAGAGEEIGVGEVDQEEVEFLTIEGHGEGVTEEYLNQVGAGFKKVILQGIKKNLDNNERSI